MTRRKRPTAEAERRENLHLRPGIRAAAGVPVDGKDLDSTDVALQNHDEEFVAWPTDRGYVTVGRIDHRDPTALTVKLELQATAPIEAQAWRICRRTRRCTQRVGRDLRRVQRRLCLCHVGKDGSLLWKFPAAEPIIEPPAVLDDRVFVSTQLGGLFCLDAKSGKQLWWAPGIVHFVAASRQRVYAADRVGNVQVLDLKTGAPAGRIGRRAAAAEDAQHADRPPLSGHRNRHGAVPA